MEQHIIQNGQEQSLNSIDRKFPGFWQAVGLCVVFFIIAGIVGAVGISFWNAVFDSNGAEQTSGLDAAGHLVWLNSILNIFCFLIVIRIAKSKAKRPWQELLAPRFSALSFSLFAGLVIFGYGSSILLSEVDNATRAILPAPDWLTSFMKSITSSGWSSFIGLIIVAPLTEEAFYRGVVMNGFLKRYSSRNAIILSALLFALFHINPFQMIGAFVHGLFFGWLRVRTGSIFPSIALHAIVNSTAFMSSLLPFEIQGFNSNEHSFQPLWLDFLGILLAIVGIFLIVSILKQQREKGVNSEMPRVVLP